MSATPTPPTVTGALTGSHAPNQIEFLWERYRSLFWVIVIAIFAALGANYAWKNYKQRGINEKWSAFATSLDLHKEYTEAPTSAYGIHESLAQQLAQKDLASLESTLSQSDDQQKPFVLMAIARKALSDAKWDRAEAALTELEQKYPKHTLVKATDYPVQVRDPLKSEPDPKSTKPPELKPTKVGSPLALLREQIAAGKTFVSPPQFAQVPVPADAKKVQFELSSGGSFTIALMAQQAPKHVASFLELAAAGYWKDLAVDEIERPTDKSTQPRSMHLGFESTKDDDRTKWITTEPSKHLLDFEDNSLSHFAGAVSGRVGADGKSCADRFWIVADDASGFDGERVVFGYVVEGLDVVKRVCEESMSAQEESVGRGRPTANVRVTAVKVLP